MEVTRVENVSRVYKTGKVETYALRDVSLTIENGEFTALVGPSGSGKTTLLQLIGCLDQPTSGRVFINGKDVSKLALLYQHGKLTNFLDEQGERDKLGGWLAAMLPFVGSKAVDDHPIWSYFADRFGLLVVGHLEPLPGVPPTTKHLEKIIELIRAQDVKIVLASAYYDPRYAQFVGEKSGAKVLRMANQVDAVPGTASYVEMVSYNVAQVVGALGGANR